MLAETHTVTGTVTGCDAPDAPFVIARLEEAGATLLALPHSGFSTAARRFWPDMLRDSFIDLPADGPMRPPVPPAARISRMDEAFGWIGLIPVERVVLRRIVGARALVHPVTERHLFPWRRVGRLVGADHRAAQRWHADGVDLIVAALLRRGFIFQA